MNSVTELRLCDIASHDVLTVTADMPLRQVVATLLNVASRRSWCRGERPVGIVTERDLLRLICAGYDEGKSVRSVMSAPADGAEGHGFFDSADDAVQSRHPSPRSGRR